MDEKEENKQNANNQGADKERANKEGASNQGESKERAAKSPRDRRMEEWQRRIDHLAEAERSREEQVAEIKRARDDLVARMKDARAEQVAEMKRAREMQHDQQRRKQQERPQGGILGGIQGEAEGVQQRGRQRGQPSGRQRPARDPRAENDPRADPRGARGAAARQPSEAQERIVAAALELLNEVGLSELSLRALARPLGWQAPALYWHFRNKDQLIDSMAEAILKREFATLVPRREDEAWQDWLVQVCQRLRRAMKSYNDGARIVAGAHPDAAVTLFKIYETGLESLTSAGLDLRRATLVLTTALHFVFGRVIEEQSSPAPEELDASGVLDQYLGNTPLLRSAILLAREEARNGYDDFEDAVRLIVGPSPA